MDCICCSQYFIVPVQTDLGTRMLHAQVLSTYKMNADYCTFLGGFTARELFSPGKLNSANQYKAKLPV